MSGSSNGDWRLLAFGMWGHVFWNKLAVSEQHAATIFRVEAYSEVEDSRFLCNFGKFLPEYVALFPKWHSLIIWNFEDLYIFICKNLCVTCRMGLVFLEFLCCLSCINIIWTGKAWYHLENKSQSCAETRNLFFNAECKCKLCDA